MLGVLTDHVVSVSSSEVKSGELLAAIKRLKERNFIYGLFYGWKAQHSRFLASSSIEISFFLYSAFLLFHFRLINSIVKINLQWCLLPLYPPLESSISISSIWPVPSVFQQTWNIYVFNVFLFWFHDVSAKAGTEVQRKFLSPFEEREGEWKSQRRNAKI